MLLHTPLVEALRWRRQADGTLSWRRAADPETAGATA
jgi:hypothetical protein